MFKRLKGAWLRYTETPTETLQRIRPSVEAPVAVTARATDTPAQGEVNTHARNAHAPEDIFREMVWETFPQKDPDGSFVVVDLDKTW